MRGRSPFSRQTVIAVLLATVVATGVFGSALFGALPASAQVPGAPQVVVDPGANAQLGAITGAASAGAVQQTAATANDLKQTTWQVLKISLTNTAALALLNGVHYFAQKIAYDTAVYIASGGNGQKPLFTTEGLGNYLQNTAADAAGEVVGTLTTDPASFGKYGINLCVPKNPTLALNLKTNFLNGLPGILGQGGPTPPKPRCSWDSITSNWDSFTSQDSSEVLNSVGIMFSPGESSLSAAIELNNVVFEQIAEKNLESYGDYLANKGFKPVRDFISRDIKTPASTIDEEMSKALPDAWKQSQNTVAISGSAFQNAAFGILPAALQTFGGALSEQLLKKVFQQGLITLNSFGGGSSKDQTLTFNGAPPLGGRAAAELANASLLTPKIASITNYNALTDFATCPETGRGPNHCVMDTQFYNAVSRAEQGSALTLRQAVAQGMLSRSWQLLPLAHRKSVDANCYKEAFCYTNLVKLRLARVIPIGWEMAANSPFNDVNRPVTLGEAMDRFEDCPRDAAGNVDSSKLPDQQHPWCHMIDPEWVLKYPVAICRQQAPGPMLLSPQAASRIDSCVDATSCIAQDASGNCIGGYGYCVAEKSVWKLDADSCPAQFSSCTVYKRADSTAFSYLANTLDAGPCNSQNAGCRQYSLSSNAVPNAGFEDLLDDEPRDWTLSAGARLHRSGTLSAHGTNALGVYAGQDASVTVPSILPDKKYVFSAAAIQELEGTNAVGTARLSFRKANGSPVDASTLATTCLSESSGRAVSFTIATTALGYLSGSCEVTAPSDAASAILEISSDAPAAGNRTWFDDVAVFGAAYSASPYDGIFLNSQAAKCASGDAGCTEFVRITTGTLNLVRNPGFEEADEATGGPRFWDMDESDYEKDSLKGSEGASAIALSPAPATQDVSGLLADAAYSFSISTRHDGTGPSPLARAAIQLYDASPTPQPVSPATVDGCDLSGSSMRLNLAVGSGYQRANCSFTTPANVRFARIILTSDSASERVLADAVQLELSVGMTPYHEAYTPSAQRVTLKKAPAGLDCTGANPPAECARYAPSCRREEVGCNAYAPTDGGTTITAVTTANDACPAACSGYDTFRQEPTQFVDAKFPLFLIPSTARSCTANEAGCSEFTNIEKLAQGGESREYFTYLRLCTKPDDETGAFYTWEGNDVRGYQLRSWSLRDSNLVSAIGPADPTGGRAPCTKLAYDGTGRPACADDAVSTAAASCTKGDMIFNPDCREFYDVDGNIHYRLYTKTVLSSDDCKEYRITKSTETECRAHGGRWANGECRYLAYAPESVSCSNSANDCRAYSGNASRNVRVLFSDGFEQGSTDGWSGGVNSNEAVSAGGHSLKASAAEVTKSVSTVVRSGKFYLLTFWAKGTGDLLVKFSQAGDQAFTFNRANAADAPIALTTEWRPYQVGPVEAVRAADAAERLVFQHAGGSAPALFLDNIEFREVADNVYLIENSWSTPIQCDQTPSGASAPQYMLGCRAYSDRNNTTATYKSFEKLCRAAAVGCEALYDTRNSVSPFAQTFRAVCTLSSACVPGSGLTCPCAVDGANVCQVTKGATSCRYDIDDEVSASHVSPDGDTARVAADGIEYLVNDRAYRCDAAAIGCTAMGDKRMNSARTAVESWNTVYLRNLPADYGRTLCGAPEQYCQAYTRNADAAPVYFKDPENRICEFRDGATGSRGWFKKGSNEGCDPTFLEAGDRYGIWKNSDANYDGWAGECSPQYDMCKEFVDPAATSTTHPKGQPYYAILNDRLDTQTCSNKVSLNQSPSGANTASACVLFWQTDNLAKTYDSAATYALSDAQHGALVTPQQGGASNDANVIIRVQRDRQCGEWLDCRSSETVFNASTGQYQNVCTAYSLCAEFERVGNTTRCVRYVESAYADKILTPNVYGSRTTGFKGMDYSGYAIPNRYSIDELVTVNVGTSAAKPDLRLVYVGGTCTSAYGASCGPASDQGTCLGPDGSRLCVYPIDGGRRITSATQLNQPQIVSGYPGASCRAYPQEDAPFPSSVADPNGWNYDAAEINNDNPVLISPGPAFTGANICQRRLVGGVEVSSCECNYQIAKYGNEKKYFPANSSDIPTGYCAGGAFEGYECDPLASGARSKNSLSCCTKAPADTGFAVNGCDDGAQCVRLNKVDRVVGYEGQCLEYDFTRPINGASDQYACLTWRPVGLIGGSRDIYNQNQTAGYFASSDRRFYCVGEQATWGVHHAISTVAGPKEQSTNNFFGPGVIANPNPSYNADMDCDQVDDDLDGVWCTWPAPGTQGVREVILTDGNADLCGSNGLANYGSCSIGTCLGDDGKPTGGIGLCAKYVPATMDTSAHGILGCYEVKEGGNVGSTYIDYPYIGPPLYRQQLQSIYFQMVDDVYRDGEITMASNPTNPWRAVDKNCNTDEDDNLVQNYNIRQKNDRAVTDADVAVIPPGGLGGQNKNIAFLYEGNQWKVDPSNGDGVIMLLASFDSNGRLKSVRVAASDTNDSGTFGIESMGFVFKPGCEKIAQVDKDGEFGATVAFTDTVNNVRTFGNFFGQEDVLGQEWTTENACRPFGAIGAISSKPPTKPWTYVAARLSTEAEQCTVTDFLVGANYTEPFGGINNLTSIRRLFRKVYGLWTYAKLTVSGGGNSYSQDSNAAANPADQGETYYNETGTSDVASLVSRGLHSWHPPVVAAVDTSNCDLNGRCKVARLGSITVNGRSQGPLLGADGALGVTAKFYAWASHNSMPILQRTVLWGDYTAKEPAAKGWYKNQKPFCSPDISDENAVGECNIGGLTCNSNEDCLGSTCNKAVGNHFGNTPGACTAGAFQFDHTYTCTLQDLQAMPACSGPGDAADNAPCYRVLNNAPTCVYRPKVQIVDNWGWCNCTGSACLNGGDGAYRAGCSLSNPPANAKPWTEYAGEIRLSPRAEDATAFVPGSGGGSGGGGSGGGGFGGFGSGVLNAILQGGGSFFSL